MKLYILSVSYTKPFSVVETHFPAHVEWLQERYRSGMILAFAKKVPLTGGIVIAAATDLETLRGEIEKDPFVIGAVAAYDITEIEPTRINPRLLDFAQDRD
ncbi:GTP cyclohydrolase [Xanthomonas hyacinthi]|uniref:YCII-related domain-containing protein n=1 Tax=Xanthomonas hyacinthi TaxID=56455 RepID=A0A2S7ESN4_9XANT|nr:YciI family protein [Xanthomonas hyacinthi]PPU96144.1 hypothetical protein XhyaCFBP1156_16240 [Xanthomonas hyacinthi]QGY77405.1 GTP cyclohydrolase [Xanthomonas hyacinthi]